MIYPSSIQPDVELAAYLTDKVSVGLSDGTTEKVNVYSDWERPTNGLPNDFIVVYINGGVDGVGMDANFAHGFIQVNLYSKMNDDGSVKKSRVKKLLEQFDSLLHKHATENYYFEYASPQFITPTTPNQSTGYSVTSLNIEWHTINNFNNS